MTARGRPTQAARSARPHTPIRAALEPASPLLPRVCDGINAVERQHRALLQEEVRADFDDSLDLDKAMEAEHSEENRWDDLLGYTPSGAVVGLEPHSARQDQISTVIKKRTAARQQLEGHLKPGKHVVEWLWVASGKVHFADTEKARRRLDQNGIRFVGRKVLRKHLPRES